MIDTKKPTFEPTNNVECNDCSWSGIADDAWTPQMGGICPLCSGQIKHATKDTPPTEAQSTKHYTLPGHWKGLLRQCSPVVKEWHIVNDDEPDEIFDVFGVVVKQLLDLPDDPRTLCWFDDVRVHMDNSAPVFLRLNLHHTTGQQHAALWLNQFKLDLLDDMHKAINIREDALEGTADPAELHALCHHLHEKTRPIRAARYCGPR